MLKHPERAAFSDNDKNYVPKNARCMVEGFECSSKSRGLPMMHLMPLTSRQKRPNPVGGLIVFRMLPVFMQRTTMKLLCFSLPTE